MCLCSNTQKHRVWQQEGVLLILFQLYHNVLSLLSKCCLTFIFGSFFFLPLLKHVNPPNVPLECIFSHAEKSRNQFWKDTEVRSWKSLNCLSSEDWDGGETGSPRLITCSSATIKWRAYWPAVALSGSHSAEESGRTCWQVLRAGGRLIRSPRSTLTDTYAAPVLCPLGRDRGQTSKTNMLENQLLSHNN